MLFRSSCLPDLAPNVAEGLGDNCPAYYISWDDGHNLIAALNAHIANTAQGPATFRLPSESEWEYACRAGTLTRFFFGDSLTGDDFNTDGPAGTLPGNRSDYMWFWFNCQGNENGARGTKPVGTKQPNQFGLFDVHGNVAEWCQDWYHVNYNGAPADGSPWETLAPKWPYRVVRGGSWHSNARNSRSACRDYVDPVSRPNTAGIRLARTAE